MTLTRSTHFTCALMLALLMAPGLGGCGDDDGSRPAGTDSGMMMGTDAGMMMGTDAGMMMGTDAGGGIDAGMMMTDAGGGVDAGMMMGSGATGTACAADGDCSAGTCMTTFMSFINFPGGYCSGSCTAGGGECGAGAECLVLFGGSGNCLATCMDDADCRMGEGYTCGMLPVAGGGGGGSNYCVPPFMMGAGGFP